MGQNKGKMVYVTKDSGERVSFRSGMTRDTDKNKPRYDLIYQPMIKRLADRHAQGIAKYGERNWENANSIEELKRFKASAYRHFMDWFNDWNPEEDHASAFMFNVNAAEYVKDKLGLKDETKRSD